MLDLATLYEEVLRALVSTIEATGGVTENEDGTFSPVGDPDWIDLGDVYVRACGVLGRQMVLVESEEE